jgi:rSAM/selenodomain-associated transferase 1
MTRRPTTWQPPGPAAGFAVIVMAKAPVAGYAKSRLAPLLGPNGAAALAERLLLHAVAQAADAGFDTVELCVSPDAGHPAFQRLRARYGLRLVEQGDGTLGDRMHRAFDRALSVRAGAVLIGTDAPSLDAARLRAAAATLAKADAVFVPAHDGGYALVGLRRPVPALFDGVAWSTDQVMCQTRQKAAACGLQLVELAAVADIDEPADLVHLPAGWVT